MPGKKVESNKAVLNALSKINAEVGRLRDDVMVGVGDVTDVGVLAADDGINQSCNGICGESFGRITKVSRGEAASLVAAAARYNIEQLQAASALEISDHINQGCNGIC